MQKFKTLRQTLDLAEEEQLLEKLKSSDPTGKWVSDFVHSDNPKFAGKSKKERIKMALGASYAAKRAEGKIKEEAELHEEIELDESSKLIEVEHLDEISAGLAKKVAQARDKSAADYDLTPTQSRRLKMGDKGGDPDMNAAKALKSAMKRGAKNVYGEEVEHLEEGRFAREFNKRNSKERTFGKYEGHTWKVMANDNGHTVETIPHPKGHDAEYYIAKNKEGKKVGHYDMHSKRGKLSEEVEHLDELSKGLLARYAKAATHSSRIKQKIAKDFEAGAERSRKPDMKASGKELSRKYQDKAIKREAGVGKAIDRLAKEEVEHLDEISKKTLGSYIKQAAGGIDNSVASTFLDAGARHARGEHDAATKDAEKGAKRIRGIKQATNKLLAKEEVEDKLGIHKVSVTINDKDKDDRDMKIEKMLKVKANNQAAALAIAKKHYGGKGYKVHNASYHGIHEEGKLSSGAKDPCWKGYEMVGTKKKNGKEVPNCVPKK